MDATVLVVAAAVRARAFGDPIDARRLESAPDVLLASTPSRGRLTPLGRFAVVVVALLVLSGAGCEGENAMVAHLVIEAGGERLFDDAVTCPFSETDRFYTEPWCGGLWECSTGGWSPTQLFITPETCPVFDDFGIVQVQFRLCHNSVSSNNRLSARIDIEDHSGPVILADVTGGVLEERPAPRFEASAESVFFQLPDARGTIDFRDVELQGVIGIGGRGAP